MTNYTELAESYIATWNETDDQRRRDRVEQTWSPTGRYIDPLTEAEGHDAISATIGAVQQQFPGLRFQLLGPVDGHHAQARFQWGLGPADAEPLVVGFDVVTVTGDGRLGDVLGFLDKVPAA